MHDQVHGHQVLKMMIESRRTYTEDSLRAAILEQFGGAARFHTCSASDMTAEELIRFLAERGKLASRGEGLTADPAAMCGD